MLWLIPLFPLLGFLINATLGRRLSQAVSGAVACFAMTGAFLTSALAVWNLTALLPGDREVVDRLYTWFSAGDFSVDLAFRLDPLSAVMILVITGIGSLIHVYSTSYMHEETAPEFARYFSYLNLFVFFMLLLVLGANVLVMFVGWEGVGLCSYLLIGYYYERKSASDAANKAFIVNRIGDYAFILGTLLAVVTFGTLDFTAMAKAAASMPAETTFGTLSIITLLFFIGATGKSAQIPLYTWLPDAMEGPTPVSALIHAATMVTAGVYMIGRNAELFAHTADTTLQVVAVVGAATALFAGTIGLVQNDIKRVLAYSTVSQLGYMFLAMGVGAYSAGIFHLFTHAFFKALLFLGSGAVIHALHGEQDIRKMGGLRKALPITYWTFVIGSLAIAGVPGLAGFFSKDEILFETFREGHTILWVVGALTSLLTATYMFRLVFLTFHGEPRFEASSVGHGHGAAVGPHTPEPHDTPEMAGHAPTHQAHPAHLHDAPPAMAFALIVLAIGSIGAGYLGIPHALGGSNRFGTFLDPVVHSSGSSAGEQHGSSQYGGPGLPSTALGTGEPRPVQAEAAFDSDQAREASALRKEMLTLVSTQPHEAAATEVTHDETALELTLMGVSTAIAFIGIGLAAFLYLRRPELPGRIAGSFSGVHRLLLNKYYVDELYNAAVVQPIKVGSREGLWRGVDMKVIDGAVNGAGYLVAGMSALLRLVQDGSVKTYAASTFLGAVLILGYYLWR